MQNAPRTPRETIASPLFWTVLLLRQDLKGAQLKIQTDHDVLRWILNLVETSKILAPWPLPLFKFEFNVL